VILEHQGNDLNATFTLANTLPPTGEFTLAVLASSTDGSKARVLGADWLDGKLIGYYVVDSAQSPTQRNLKGEPFVDGTVIKGLVSLRGRPGDGVRGRYGPGRGLRA
jgi:hypothetical protein